MKKTTLLILAKIAEGKLISNNPSVFVSILNFAKHRYLRKDHVYFFTRQTSIEKQLAAIRSVRPIAVVLPYSIPTTSIPHDISIIQVKDAYDSYWKLAKWNWKQCPTKVIAITGSAGKSTTTAMAVSILKQRARIVTTEGNLNTLPFLPNYLTRLRPEHSLLLLELGMKSLNNIYRQCQIINPQIGAITNVGEAHVGNLGHLDEVVRAKQELIDGMRPGGIVYLNADCPRSQKLNTSKFTGKVVRFGVKNPASLQGKNIRLTSKGMAFDAIIEGKTIPVLIPVFGTHNVYNALAAIGVSKAYGATIKEIQKGLATFQPPRMRLQLIPSRSGRLLINDAWNANPTAMIAGLNVLKEISNNRFTVAVLGDMLELGYLTHKSHIAIGQHVAGLKIDQLITLGKHGELIAEGALASGMPSNKMFSYYSHEQLLRHLVKLPTKAIIFFKASRKLRLEKVVDLLK